jgi:hypothetical protein
VAVLAALPTVTWLALLAAAGWLGLATGVTLGPGRASLVGLCLATFAWQLWSRPASTLATHAGGDGGRAATT